MSVFHFLSSEDIFSLILFSISSIGDSTFIGCSSILLKKSFYAEANSERGLIFNCDFLLILFALDSLLIAFHRLIFFQIIRFTVAITF